jgi:hypothetical protein
VISLPGSEKTTRGYSKANLIILDEAARIDAELITSLAPMQAVASAGRRRFVAMSTPAGRLGWFYDRWQASAADRAWRRVLVSAMDDCPRITAEFLEEQRRELGPLLFDQEYLCRFVDSAETLFSAALVERAFDAGITPLFGGVPSHAAA